MGNLPLICQIPGEKCSFQASIPFLTFLIIRQQMFEFSFFFFSYQDVLQFINVRNL